MKDGIVCRVLDDFCVMYNHLESLFIEVTINNERVKLECSIGDLDLVLRNLCMTTGRYYKN